jgi:ABC-2 type transport system permease protein
MAIIGHLCWKELKAYFTSWLAYAVLAGWLFIAGYTWLMVLGAASSAGNYFLAPVYQNFMVMLIFITPLLTMRLLAEEQREGTMEMLFTSPLTEWQVTLGKWIGALIFMSVMIALTLYIPLFSLRYGSIDVGPLWGGYLALFCVSAVALAYGLFCSSLTDSQVVAGFLTFGGLLLSWMFSWLAGNAASAQNPVLEFLMHASIYSHFARMLQGALDTGDLVFFAGVTLFFLYATRQVLESRKWR